MIIIPDSLYEKFNSEKYFWGSSSQREFVKAGNMFEVAVQLFLGVQEKNISLRDGSKGTDNGIDFLYKGQKFQCKAAFLNKPKNFILLDNKINSNVDFYCLGLVYEDFKQAEIINFVKTPELISLIEVGKIIWHETYSKWCYILNSAIMWIDTQTEKNNLESSIVQNIPCFIYKSRK